MIFRISLPHGGIFSAFAFSLFGIFSCPNSGLAQTQTTVSQTVEVVGQPVPSPTPEDTWPKLNHIMREVSGTQITVDEKGHRIELDPSRPLSITTSSNSLAKHPAFSSPNKYSGTIQFQLSRSRKSAGVRIVSPRSRERRSLSKTSHRSAPGRTWRTSQWIAGFRSGASVWATISAMATRPTSTHRADGDPCVTSMLSRPFSLHLFPDILTTPLSRSTSSLAYTGLLPIPGLWYDVGLFWMEFSDRTENQALNPGVNNDTIQVNTGDTRHRGFEGELAYDLLELWKNPNLERCHLVISI